MLRGVAVFGILVVNVQQIFLPVVLASAPVAVIPGATGSKLAWFVTDAFFESKFITVFSLLFGAGFRLQWMRYKELGKPFVRLYLRWVAMLACFGLIHATFFYYADVLVLYALTALVLLLFRNRGPRSMFRTRLILLFVMTAWHVLLSGPDPDASATRHQVVQNLKSIREGGDVTLAGERVALPVRAARIAEHLHGDIHGADEATAQALA